MINRDKVFEMREGSKASGAIGRSVGCVGIAVFIDGARGGTRTPTHKVLDPKSSASANSATLALRARAKTTSHFRIPSSVHFWPCLNRKILEIVLLFLWPCSLGATKPDPNPGANSVNLFLREP